MITKFTFENVFSFKEKQTLSMVMTSKKERLWNDENNYSTIDGKNRILRSAVFYGANASGKSNFHKAVYLFKELISKGNQNLDNIKFNLPTFQLDDSYKVKPMIFEVECIWKGKELRYGFSINTLGLEEEWFYQKKERWSEIFYRKKQEFKIPANNKVLKELTQKKMVHSKSFLVTAGAQFNNKICADFLDWINNLNTMGIEDTFFKEYTVKRIKAGDAFSRKVIELIKSADFGIEDVSIKTYPGQNIKFSSGVKTGVEVNNANIDDLVSKRLVIDINGEPILRDFSFVLFESAGTQKFTHILGPILDTLENGKILVIDELDSKLHPELTDRLIELFHNKEINKKNAQLIFTTHNTNLLSNNKFRRDQIYFVDKTKFGISNFYSLAEFKLNGKATRNDENIENNYLKGKYGAIPFLDDFDNLLMN